jgi:hypothetical protein
VPFTSARPSGYEFGKRLTGEAESRQRSSSCSTISLGCDDRTLDREEWGCPARVSWKQRCMASRKGTENMVQALLERGKSVGKEMKQPTETSLRVFSTVPQLREQESVSQIDTPR